MAAGIATVKELYEDQNIYTHIETIGTKLENGIKEISKEKNINIVINRIGGMMTVFFTDLKEINNYEDAKSCNTDLFKKYFMHMLDKGINLPPSQFEAMFLSTCHSDDDINKFLTAFKSFNI